MTPKELHANTVWAREPEGPQPRVVVQSIVYDLTHFFVHRRSQNVRSAKGVWSFPTGLQELGETVAECAIRELHEEWRLSVRAGAMNLAGMYERVAADKPGSPHGQYHWVIINMLVYVPGWSHEYFNSEPEKHDRVAGIKLRDMDRNMDLRVDLAGFEGTFKTWWLLNDITGMVVAQCKHRNAT